MSEFETLPLMPAATVDNWELYPTPEPIEDGESWHETGSDWDDPETEAEDDVNTDAEDNANTDAEDNANTNADDNANTEAIPIDSLTIELDDIRFESAGLHRFVVQLSNKHIKLQSTVEEQDVLIDQLVDILEHQDSSKATRDEVLELRRLLGRRCHKTEDRLTRTVLAVTDLEWKNDIMAAQIKQLQGLVDNQECANATRDEVLQLHQLVGRRFNTAEDRIERTEIGITDLEWKAKEAAQVAHFESRLQAQAEEFEKRLQLQEQAFVQRLDAQAKAFEKRLHSWEAAQLLQSREQEKRYQDSVSRVQRAREILPRVGGGRDEVLRL
jgi:hypothetical protein